MPTLTKVDLVHTPRLNMVILTSIWSMLVSCLGLGRQRHSLLKASLRIGKFAERDLVGRLLLECLSIKSS